MGVEDTRFLCVPLFHEVMTWCSPVVNLAMGCDNGMF